MAKPRVVILGGGMAGLTTAWELSTGDWREHYSSIRVYQRGWRLGGKGASSRGSHGRIEEHGLHVLLGYYHDTFRIMQDCYAELNRSVNRPSCPILTWEQAVKPAATVGLTERVDDGWLPWTMEFPRGPGMPGGRDSAELPNVAQMALQSIQLLAAFHTTGSGRVAPVTLSPGPTPQAPLAQNAVAVLRAAGLTALAGLVEILGRLESAIPASGSARLGGVLQLGIGAVRRALYEPLRADQLGARTWTLVDLVMTNLAGIVADRLLTRPEGVAAINDMDYRDWLRRHGAADETVDNAIVRGMYDLVFAYQGGDPERPAFAAGLGLELATQMLLGYDGSLFWKMQAGMGEVIFAPLYEALLGRGVEFEFFHRVDELTVADGAIATIRMGRQATLREPQAGYRPLAEVGGLPAWPAQPDAGQLVDPGGWLAQSESFSGERRDAAAVELRTGDDFDVVVFAASLGIVPHICSQLIEAEPRWRAMVEHLGTVATQAFQLWLKEDEERVGWPGGPGVTLSGFAPPFDTWASMSHLIDRESWPASEGVRAIAYFCGSLADDGGSDPEVRAAAVRYLGGEVGVLWPEAVADGEFRWELLAGSGTRAGEARFDSQYWRANTDPSDRYVQSLPGTDRYRLSPGDTGFDNLVVAGDWTDCGLNAGCVEAATRSGILAAAAVAKRLQPTAKGYQ